MDFSQSIRLAVESGKVELGMKKALKLSTVGGAKLIVVSKSCPEQEKLEDYCGVSQTPVVAFEGNGMELGEVCGKPFSVTALSVLEEGNSDILKLAQSPKTHATARAKSSKQKTKEKKEQLEKSV